MQLFVYALELFGIIAFAVSGAMIGIKRNMDAFGVCILGLTTSCGGGLIRDVILGKLPPVMFENPVYALFAIICSVIVFLTMYFKYDIISSTVFENVMLVADSIGLGVFTVSGLSIVISEGYGSNFFFTIFLTVLTGVGGGLMRDILSEQTPYIFVKHIYACAALTGAIISYILWDIIGDKLSMITGCIIIVVFRLLAARYKWNFPKINKI